MVDPLISIIVPVYGVEAYLNECVQSIVNQTYPNLEIILVDDGSPDQCPQMCDAWAEKDSRIRVIHKPNGGLSSARNAGLNAARGAYVGFIDSDDYVAENMYELLLRGVLSGNYGISCCYFSRKIGDKILKHPESKAGCTYTAEEAINEFFWGREVADAVWDKLFAAELFCGIRFPEGETNEDWPLIVPLVVRAGGVYHTGEALYVYRVRETSITQTYWKRDLGVVLKHLREMNEQLDKYGLENNKKAFRLFCTKAAYSAALVLCKNYGRIDAQAKENYKKFIGIMKENTELVLVTEHMVLKDKILYLMILTKTLRPIYKLLGKPLA